MGMLILRQFFSNFVSPFENSTTRIAITQIITVKLLLQENIPLICAYNLFFSLSFFFLYICYIFVMEPVHAYQPSFCSISRKIVLLSESIFLWGKNLSQVCILYMLGSFEFLKTIYDCMRAIRRFEMPSSLPLFYFSGKRLFWSEPAFLLA